MSAILSGKLLKADMPKLDGKFYKEYAKQIAIAEGETETAIIIKSNIYDIDELKADFSFIEQMTYDDTVLLGETIDPPRVEETELGDTELGFRPKLSKSEILKAQVYSGVQLASGEEIETELQNMVNVVGAYLAIKFENVESVELDATPNNVVMNSSNAGSILLQILNHVETKKADKRNNT